MSNLNDQQSSKKQPAEQSGYNFGTFKGVFVPSVLTILGVIMYMRFGWVLGNVGLAKTLIIVTLATSITFLTGLSISALATNMKVGGGGAYYIISRSLGVEIGAAIGLPLFFGQALGISFYSVGFAESISGFFPFLSIKVIGIITLTALTLLVYFSVDFALKAQLYILILIAASLVSFFAGNTPADLSPAADIHRQTFWPVFAVFFPAVTGILSGVSMSGDLKNPARSLPLGTISAVLICYIIYMGIPIFLAGKIKNPDILITNPLIMRDTAYFGPLVIAALWGATLSSGIGTLLGAPRILQALAKDKVIPYVVGRGFGKGKDPRLATLISFAIGFAGIMVGDLNAIAPIISMFFLTTYGLLNLSAAFEGMIASPSWRPNFRVHWSLSLIGAFGCFATMFMINAGATFIAAFVSAGVYYYMKRRSMNAHWGDTRYGILMLLAQYSVYSLFRRKPDERTWRPNILVLSGSPTARWYLIELADAISQGRNFLTVGTVLPKKLEKDNRIENMKETIAEYLKKRNVTALVKVQTADNVFSGLKELIRTYGFGSIIPNTVLLGDTQKKENFIEYAGLVKLVSQTKRNLVIVRERNEPVFMTSNKTKQKRIDIWWSGHHQNGGFMLALAYLLIKSPEWTKASIILKTVVNNLEDQQEALRRLEALVTQGRLEAKIDVLIKRPEAELFDTIRYGSQGADLVFMGIRTPEENESDEEYSNYYQKTLSNSYGLPPTALVLAAQNVEFRRIFA